MFPRFITDKNSNMCPIDSIYVVPCKKLAEFMRCRILTINNIILCIAKTIFFEIEMAV